MDGEYQTASSENRSRNGLSLPGVGWALSAQMQSPVQPAQHVGGGSVAGAKRSASSHCTAM
jgi:hypothetical protein